MPHNSRLKRLAEESLCCWKALGQVLYGPTGSEKGSIRFRRSIFTVKDIGAGEIFTGTNVRIIRPGNGLHPRHLGEILGRKAAKDIRRGTPMG